MKNLCVAMLLMLCSSVVIGQEWSVAQKEVWKNVETYWALEAAGNLEGFLSYFHNDYKGWSYRSALPEDKTTLRKFVEYSFKTEKVLVYDIKPVAISVFGNFAFVHYCFMSVYKDAEGKEKSDSGRWTDILMKQGDKWVMIGDHGGRTSKD